MKHILCTIILSTLLISNIFYTAAYENDGVLGNLLEIRTGPEVYLIDTIPYLKPIKFQNPQVNQTFYKFQNIDSALRDEFIMRYRQGHYTYYEMRDLIENYKKFLHHTNRVFEYIKIQSDGERSEEMNQALYSHYSQMRKYYMEVKRLSR